MPSQIRMPDIGTVEDKVKLVRWLKAVGDRVELGEPLFEAETDKGVVAVESVAGGVVVQTMCAEGESASSGQVIALIKRDGEPGGAPESGRTS